MINPTRERIPMPEQPKNLRCTNFDEVALGYAPLEAVGEAMRCLDCREQPCVAGCPIHQNIPGFLARVAVGDFDGAYDLVSQHSSLPGICGRVCPQEQQCEKNCSHALKGEAVAIGRGGALRLRLARRPHPHPGPRGGAQGQEGGGDRLRPGGHRLRRGPGRPGVRRDHL